MIALISRAKAALQALLPQNVEQEEEADARIIAKE